MRSSAAGVWLLLCALLPGATAPPYRLALPGYRYEFPRDHFNHPEFQTEWWYYTGNLRASDGRRFGFELTFFRHGVARDERPPELWDVRDIWLAHLALSDIDGGRFFHTERLNRTGPGLAGASLEEARVWNGNWQARWGTGRQKLEAVAEAFSFELSLASEKPPVIHGEDGVSQKAQGAGRASHYISLTRLAAHGRLNFEGKASTVEGLAWMDHEFFSNELDPNQTGWDWFSLQFDDGSELMLGRLRRQDASADPYSAGTYVDPQGRARHLSASDFALVPGKIWASRETGGRYPVAWTVRVPSLHLEASVTTRLPQQELSGKSLAYWEGAIEISGVKDGKPVHGAGYLEMTGYAGRVRLGE